MQNSRALSLKEQIVLRNAIQGVIQDIEFQDFIISSYIIDLPENGFFIEFRRRHCKVSVTVLKNYLKVYRKHSRKPHITKYKVEGAKAHFFIRISTIFTSMIEKQVKNLQLELLNYDLQIPKCRTVRFTNKYVEELLAVFKNNPALYHDMQSLTNKIRDEFIEVIKQQILKQDLPELLNCDLSIIKKQTA